MAGPGPRVHVSPAAHHLQTVGSLSRFAARTGIPVSTLSPIRRQEWRTIRADIAELILNTPAEEEDEPDHPWPEWMDRGACVGLDPKLFFPPRGDSDGVNNAKAVCRGCRVRLQCLDYALSFSALQDFGIWGGRSEAERVRIRKQRRLSA